MTQYGLEEKEIAAIKNILAQHQEVEQAILYGSRAKGNFKPASDIDLVLKGDKLTVAVQNRIADELDDLLLPYKFDLSVFHQISDDDLLEHIERIGLEFYENKIVNILSSSVTLDEAAEVITGFPFKGEMYSSEGTRVLRGENVTIGDIRWDTVKCWNKPFKDTEKYSLQAGDIVIGMDGSRVGKNRAQIRQESLPLLLAQRVARLRAKPRFSQDFLAYVVKSKEFEKYVDSIKTGTSIPHISPQQIKEFRFTAPDEPTQVRIAAILSSLDYKIELNRQTNQTLEEIAKTLFQEMCVPKGDELPEGWRIGKVGEFMESVSETYKFKNKEEIIFLNTGDIQDGRFLHENYSPTGSLPGQAKKKIKRNDILFSEIRPINRRFAFVYFNPDDYVVSTKLMVLRSKCINPNFLYFFITRLEVILELQHLAETRSGTFPQITFNELSNISVVLPPSQTLGRFVGYLDAIYDLIRNNECQNQDLSMLRDSILPRLMNGEISVNI